MSARWEIASAQSDAVQSDAAQSVAPQPPGAKAPQKTGGVVTLKVVRDGKTFYGKPLATDGKKLAVVRWDGRLTTFPANDKAAKISVYSKGFEPYSTAELKSRLKKHFGKRYAISTTDHFVVIHPNNGGNGQKYWANPFEQHYTRLRNYFEAHGFKTSEPEFPMIAIVLRSRSEFDRRLDAEGDYNRNIVGYYNQISNRITTYDPTRESLKVQRENPDYNWLYSSSTIVHETAHQVAYNCGIHNRFTSVPKWTSEGLAMLCEARGIYNYKKFPDIQSRINRVRLKTLRKLINQGKTRGKLLELIQHDRMFETDPESAYAIAWGISFYLNETRQSDYVSYLERDARRGSFRAHNKLDRVGFFIDHFGKDIDALESRMNIFIGALK